MSEQVNINVKTTAAKLPWSNSAVWKHNGVIGNLMEKVSSDVKCSLDVTLVWCISDIFFLLKFLGYNPNTILKT